MARRVPVLLVLILALAALAQAAPLPAQSACAASSSSVPCGRINPFITIESDQKGVVYDLAQGQEQTIDATLTYRFDVDQDGYSEPDATHPIGVTFEFPRKPAWVDIKVEPDAFPIPVENPTFIKADTTDPASVQADWIFSAPIKITVKLTGQAILRDGYSYQKLLVFAKSSESGLYQAGYGLKEIRVAPAGALHESDVAGSKDAFTASPLPPILASAPRSTFLGTTVTLTPPDRPAFWQPGLFTLAIEPAPANGRMMAALHDEAGALVYATQALPAAGRITFNATLVKPGLHTVTLTLLPASGSATPPATFALPYRAGDATAQGYAYPKAYVVAVTEPFEAPAGNQKDPFAQFERDIPFYAFDAAQSATALLALHTDAAANPAGAVGNLAFSIVDPDGKQMLSTSVDPSAPQRSIRVGSLPVDGWYTLRIKGAGAPQVSSYDARVEVAYAAPATERNRADGVTDATGSTLSRAGVNLSMPFETLAVFAPGDITPKLDRPGAVRYQVTIADLDGTPIYGSGLRSGPATFTPTAPGKLRAFVYTEPGSVGTPFSASVRAFTFDVGNGTTTIVTKFSVDDKYEAPAGTAQETLLGFQAVPVHPGAGKLSEGSPGGGAPGGAGGGRTDLTDADGKPVSTPEPGGTYFLRALGTNPGPQPTLVPVTAEQDYATPLALASPDAPIPVTVRPDLRLPGIVLGLTLLFMGVTAVMYAVRRK